MSRGGDSRVYIGNLPPDVKTRDIEDIFHKYGRIVNLDVKYKSDQPFAFLEYEDPRDAADAVRYRDGYDFDGYSIRVEFPRGPGNAGRGRFGGGFGGGRGRGPPSRRSDYRVTVSGLPDSGSWQDLKDHMREAGDVCYADVNRDGTGVVEYLRYEDMKYALKKLDDTRFKSHEGETAYIRVREESGRGGGSRRSRTRSRSRSPRRSYTPEKARSVSPRRSRSRS